MTNNEAYQLDRTATRLIVEAKRGTGSPPSHEVDWQPVWECKVDSITINAGMQPSTAVIWFPGLRWNTEHGIRAGDRIRIRTDEPTQFGVRGGAVPTCVFSGFVTTQKSQYSGAGMTGERFERNALLCRDHRWLLHVTSVVFGQIARGPDDYTSYGTASQASIVGSYYAANGRRTVFNADKKANKDPEELVLTDADGSELYDVPIFSGPKNAELWTVGDMLRYLLSRINNQAYQYFDLGDPGELTGLDHADLDQVLYNVVADSLSPLEADGLICKKVGFSFREDYDTDGVATLKFFKVGEAESFVRDADNAIIKHRLYAPAEGESVAAAVARGERLVWAMDLDEDVAAVVNNPIAMGSPHRFEFTAELVPAWLDSELTPDLDHLYFHESELQYEETPNQYSFYANYHSDGSTFQRDVGRKWCLNEAGTYTGGSYDRGIPFDFATVIDKLVIQDDAGHRVFGPFNRRLLPCLTIDKDSLNSVGIKVEFSFDAGATWQQIGCAIRNLEDEAGIYISEPNLADIVDREGGEISGGDLDGEELNYWTSLARDKQAGNVFKTGGWQTRVRVTASVKLDQRLLSQKYPSARSGSPFQQRRLYDLSEHYGYAKRESSSIFATSDLPADDLDLSATVNDYLESLRRQNEDMSIAGQFTLERLWLGDGAGEPVFACGDLVAEIGGREYSLAASIDQGVVYPEIIRIIYYPDNQQVKLITRDLRFAEAGLDNV